MAERLTIKNSDGTYSQPIDTTFEKVFNKLAELEDIMEKYDLKVEELDKLIDGMKSTISVLLDRNKNTKQDRDIWEKACEIALKESGTWWKYDGESNANAMELYYLKTKELIKNENKINIDKYKFNKEDFIKDFDNNDIKKFENLICKTIGIDNDENKGE